MKKAGLFFLSLFRFILILLICLAAAFLIVWPLWKFATVNSKAYTITVLIILAALIIFALAKKIRNKILSRKDNVQ